ncbi:hypothetical protein GNI_148750 [Gregarina niphandrodes]|uniref:Uncharacterized protein n=1 Tax=Gregarina niphandrodes TaxID=110365 RepID=A0A023AZR2_GRENI|nr:hypothetical protein GNI_148750 [Gregarina niphandrodes]EZG44320.1 hypothetical protein GNI_148750 [Gregarina niphandrodes]|eukprot:XP_011132709.1 hypothetical protein GNI_148750 [Gregarina niphandrodes]
MPTMKPVHPEVMPTKGSVSPAPAPMPTMKPVHPEVMPTKGSVSPAPAPMPTMKPVHPEVMPTKPPISEGLMVRECKRSIQAVPSGWDQVCKFFCEAYAPDGDLTLWCPTVRTSEDLVECLVDRQPYCEMILEDERTDFIVRIDARLEHE